MKYFSVFAVAFIATVAIFGTDADALQLPPSLLGGILSKAGAGIQIVGGRPAKQGEAPYQLSLQFLSFHFCGGSLIEIDGLQVMITAAHCIVFPEARYYDVVAGDINFADNTGIEQRVRVNDILVHENWDTERATHQNDIALLFLSEPFILSENISTIPLPNQGQVTSEGNLTVSGWGKLEYGGSTPDELQIVSIPLVNDTTCQNAYKDWPSYQVYDSMICTVAPKGDLSPCQGDSGGPAVSDAGYLAGIVSFGYECGHPDYPAVYTKVSYFVDWIRSTVASYQSSR